MIRHVIPNHEPQNLQALDEVGYKIFKGLNDHVTSIKKLSNIDQINAEFLPHLAVSVQVDEWQDDWTEATKRRVIKNQRQVHNRKGTKKAVGDALRGIFDTNARAEEKTNYTYDVIISGKKTITATELAQMRRLLKKTAPVRCVLARVIYMKLYYDGTKKYNGVYRYDGGIVAGS